MTHHKSNQGIATMIDAPETMQSRTIFVPKVRTDAGFVFLLLTPTDEGDVGSISAVAGQPYAAAAEDAGRERRRSGQATRCVAAQPMTPATPAVVKASGESGAAGS